MAGNRMRRFARMAMVSGTGNREAQNRGDYGRREGSRMEMGYGGSMNYGAESRFRDRRGRWHYNNGRFAPRSETNIEIEGRFRDDHDWQRRDDQPSWMMNEPGMDYDPESGYDAESYVPPVYGNDMRYRGDGVRQIGFMAHGNEMGGDYKSDAEYRSRNEMESHKGHAMNGYASGSDVPKLTREKAEQWVRSMQNANGTRGQNWNMEQARHIMTRYGCQCDPLEFYVALNMMKSDYGKVAAQLGVDKEEFYAAMAKAFLMDDDAHSDKLARYWCYVAKG